MKLFRGKREGKYTVLRAKWQSYEIDCFDFYVSRGMLVIEHKDGDVEFFPTDSISCVVKYKSKNEAK